jgi:hypothetical protein
MKLFQEINQVNKITKFSGQNKEIQLEEFVRQIENFANLVNRTNDEEGENGEICFLFRRLLEGQADQFWRLIEEEEKNQSKHCENVKSQFQQ